MSTMFIFWLCVGCLMFGIGAGGAICQLIANSEIRDLNLKLGSAQANVYAGNAQIHSLRGFLAHVNKDLHAGLRLTNDLVAEREELRDELLDADRQYGDLLAERDELKADLAGEETEHGKTIDSLIHCASERSKDRKNFEQLENAYRDELVNMSNQLDEIKRAVHGAEQAA